MGQDNANMIWARKLKEKKRLKRLRPRGHDNIKIIVNELRTASVV
jgi:hypothetical protein